MVRQRAGKRATRSADLRKRATELRVRGATYEQIAEVLGLSVGTAWKHVNAALDLNRSEAAENAEKIREIEVRRLDRYLVKLEAAIDAAGTDPRPYVETAVKVAARRAALLGLDAPTKVAPTTPDGTEPALPAVMQVVLVRPGDAGTDP